MNVSPPHGERVDPSKDVVSRLLASLTARGLVTTARAVPARGASQGRLSLRAVFEASDMSAQEFADEVAESFGLERASLAALTSSSALSRGLSERFLREAAIFPF